MKEKSFGIIPIFKDSQNNLYFCLVQHAGEHWGFPKGHGNEGEGVLDTARRELMEETGIKDVNLLKDRSFIENYIFKKDEIIHDKTVEYFVGFVSDMKTDTLENFKKEISEIKWLPYNEAKDLITFPEAKRILDEIINILI
ncbi:MAG: NUDIX domain-containing protein [Candidatus Paceibacterota bacterium]